jgi:hypothetical protein
MFADAMKALYIILYIVPFSILRYYPFINKLRISLHKLCGIYIGLLLIEIVGFLWLARHDFWNLQFTQSYRMIFALFFALFSFAVIKEKFFKHFFVYLVMFAYSAIVCRTAHMLELLLNPYFPDVPDYFITNITILLQLGISYPLVFRFFKIKFTPLLETKNTEVWNYIWIIPMVLILFGFLFGVDFSEDAISDWRVYISRWVMSFGIFYCCVILIKILEQTNKNATLNENIRMTGKLLAAQSNHYKLLTDNIDKAKAAKHDLHHHILVMQSYLHNKQFAELEEYLNQYQVRLTESAQPSLCKHYIVDAILQHYRSVAAESGIQFAVKVDMPVQVRVADLDICIILGNVIENAIEACQRMKDAGQFINLHIKMIGDMLIVTLDNSYDGRVKQAATALVSSKRSDGEEGVGLSSVKSVVNKYNGVLKIDYTANIFKTSIMLKEKKKML